MKKLAILQSNYIPWRGYFDLIAHVDLFIFYDDVQFTKNDWRNRNKIKTPKGTEWLSIPVGKDINRQIRQVEISDSKWKSNHWKTIEFNYRRAKYFDQVAALLEPIYTQDNETNLSIINRRLIEAICNFMGIKTLFNNAWDYKYCEGKTERLVSLCQQVGATEYISGPAAKDYLQVTKFEQSQIKVTWFDYDGYQEYPQLWGAFENQVSIIDLLFNCGKDSNSHLKINSKQDNHAVI